MFFAIDIRLSPLEQTVVMLNLKLHFSHKSHVVQVCFSMSIIGLVLNDLNVTSNTNLIVTKWLTTTVPTAS